MQPPNFTPDNSIRHISSRLTYICPPPPPAISQHPQKDYDRNPDLSRPNYGFDYLAMTSTPIPNDEEEDGEKEAYFKLPSRQPVHVSSKVPPVLPPLIRSSSTLSEVSIDEVQEGSTTTLPSPPSLFMLADKKVREIESTEGSNDEDSNASSSASDLQLFQPTEPFQVNKILEDIQEEEEDEGVIEKTGSSVVKPDSSGQVPQAVLEQCLADIDDFLKDIRKSQLLEITEREHRLSRQSSFTAGPPPLLPPTPPPGPTLSPKHSVNNANPFLSPSFQNALKRLSNSSMDDAVPPLHQQRSFDELNRDSLPPPLPRQDSEEYEMQRQSSISNNYVQPPDAFSSDSGLPFSSDNELYSQTDTENKRRQIMANAREVDTRTTSSQVKHYYKINRYYFFPYFSILKLQKVLESLTTLVVYH